ncbi:hypothetical protein F4Z99_11330 [Candidatus Poribacteria bacterium]|nr:hypothetical protein [Candidatus Poribacteria bacterium]MYB00205.1 hypothetical protein [Candidatus Poribacteria bacterium]
MNLQSFRQKLGVFVGVIVLSFNVVTTAQTDNRPQVRARVVFADGTPLVNANIYVLVADRDFDGSGFGHSGGTTQTDSAGYFVETLDGNADEFYILGVAYQGRFAKAPPFISHKGQPQVHLLLTLSENQVLPDRWSPDKVFTALEAFLEPPPVWVVNPTNGHAYKRIYCPDIMDAMTLAAAENAYLVSINDAAEEAWILGVFDPDSFWIGLSDFAEEGQWVWHSGEPVTYTNWGEDEQYGGNTEINDYAISAWGDKWQAVAPGDTHTPFLKEAILESVHTPVKQMRSLSEIGVWAVNPANGHAYIKIRCKSLDDARDRAAAEDAHLVAINDEAEQKWLLGLFGNHLYWIGLSDAEREGKWVWQNGEPLTYENWGAKHSFPRSTLSSEDKDSAVMTFLNGQWHAVGPGDLLWRMTKMAILEKTDVFNNSRTGAE